MELKRVPKTDLTEMNLGPQGADHPTSDEPAASPIFSDGDSYDEEEEEEPVIQASTSQPSTWGLASKVPVLLFVAEEELEEEVEIPLNRKRKVPDAKLPSNDSIEMSQDVAGQGAEGDLPDFVPTAVKVRPYERRKLILPADESEDENNQVTAVAVDPKETTEVSTEMQSPVVNKEMADQGPSKVGEGQSLALATTTAAETSTPTSQTICPILSQGEVFSRVPPVPAVQLKELPCLLLRTVQLGEQSCKSSEVLMKPASRLRQNLKNY